MKIKTSELIGPALDWAVEFAELERVSNTGMRQAVASRNRRLSEVSYSTNWAQGGQIIFRMKPLIGVVDPNTEDEEWYCTIPPSTHEQVGDTPLIAAMRCYVASKLGAEVDVPEELI